MRCIQLASSVGCSRVPQVHFVRKQTMCKSVCTYLTICFACEKPRWLLPNTADRAETVFSHLNCVRNKGTSFASCAFACEGSWLVVKLECAFEVFENDIFDCKVLWVVGKCEWNSVGFFVL